MKILIVGSNLPWAIERHFIKYLSQFGAEVHLYTAPDIVFKYHSENLFNKILFKTKIKTGYREVNTGLLELADLIKPEIIWAFKGMEIYPDTWKILKKQSYKLANFNPDHPFIISGSGSGNKNVTQSVALFDLHFCYHRQLIRNIESKFHIPAVFLPFAYEETDLTYMDPVGIKEIMKICFQGNPDKYRVDMISFLADNDLEVDVYGHDWQKTRLAGKSKVKIYPIASRTDFWKKNQEYRIQLNLFREHNEGSHNMRTFEIPAVGGIQLAEYSAEQAEFFTEDEEIFFFGNKTEMIEKARMLMNISGNLAAKIRTHARKRSVESGYTFADRAKAVYHSFKTIL